jgi:hypothetical protein
MFRLLFAQKRLDIGDRELHRIAMQRIGHGIEFGLQMRTQAFRRLERGTAANPHFGKVLMINFDGVHATMVA